MVITYGKGKDQPGKVANPARGQLNRENDFSLFPFAPENSNVITHFVWYVVYHTKNRGVTYRPYFQHTHIIPMVGVGKRGEY